MKLYIKPFFIMVSLASVSGGMTALDQAMLERRLACYAHYEDGQYVPVRRRDILSSYTGFIQETGCTTNELIEGLMFAVTNNLTECNWTNETGRAVATAAALHLGEIDNSSITNFFRILNDTDTSDRLKDISIPAMFWHTNLEPEVLSYMRNICVRTNIYDRIAPLVSHYIYETIDLMPDDLKALIPLAPAWMIPDAARAGNLAAAEFDPDHIPDELVIWGGKILGGDYARTAQLIHPDTGRPLWIHDKLPTCSIRLDCKIHITAGS